MEKDASLSAPFLCLQTEDKALKSKNQGSSKKIFYLKGKTLGFLLEGVFHKVVCRSKHFFRALKAWGNDKAVLLELMQIGCSALELYEKESGKIYRAALQTILQKGIEKDCGPYGVQVFLPEKEWQVKDPGQLALFGEVG